MLLLLLLLLCYLYVTKKEAPNKEALTNYIADFPKVVLPTSL